MRNLALAAVLMGLSIFPVAALSKWPTPPSFSREIVPILKSRCVSCHMTGAEPGKMSLVPNKAYETIVGVRATSANMARIEPGKPGRSYLLLKLRGEHLRAGGKGSAMPLGGAPLPKDKIDLIDRWVVAGAPRN